MGQRAEHPADGVAQLAVGVDIGLQHVLAEPLVLPIVGRHHPQPQDIGAGLLDDVLRHHRVAERLRHLAAVLVHGEAMGDDGVVGRAAARAAAFEQRGMEPAAMLVGAFEIDVGRPFEVGPVLQREGVRRAGIEPDVEDVHDLVPCSTASWLPRKRSLAPSANQASAPSVSKASRMRWLTASSFSTLPSASAKTAIGTPQARWRDSTQSGRSSIMARSRVCPAAGTKRVASIAASARRAQRRQPSPSSLSIWTNHCGVLRKMTGFFERQQCG